MTIQDDDHKVARYIKDLERRVSDLEQSSRNVRHPVLLLSESEDVFVSDSVPTVSTRMIEDLKWNSDGTGWNADAWGSYE